jgi:hypothetical protein
MPEPSIIELPSLRWTFGCIADREPRGGSHVYEQGRHFPVTNLGWLLRHSAEVHDLFVSTARYETVAIGSTTNLYGLKSYRSLGCSFDAILAARLEGGRVYVSEFADRTVLRDWLDRPKFHGRTVSWDHRTYIIGSTDYAELPR